MAFFEDFIKDSDSELVLCIFLDEKKITQSNISHTEGCRF